MQLVFICVCAACVHLCLLLCCVQILDQCTPKLRMTSAARRLYTSDGCIILDLDDLIEWMRDQYVKEAQKQLRAEARAKRQAAKKSGKAGYCDFLL